jgi:peptidoglycan/LPS O-acetylase OafA/YrhL
MFTLAVERVVLFAGMGCVAAVMLCSKPIRRYGKLSVALKYSAWLIGVPGLTLIDILAARPAGFCAVGLHITTAFFAVLILVEAVISETGMLAWLLSVRWLVYIGKISYGLYLWHYPIFCEVQARRWPMQYELLVELGLTVLATVVSFYVIERPALKLKGSLARVKKEEMKERIVLPDAA